MSKRISLQSLPASVRLELQKGIELGEAFTGHKTQVEVLDMPEMPEVLLRIGKLKGLIYEAVRDGEAQDYLHEFSDSARPLLCVTPDGHRLFILGGGYTFTDCGIVDRM